MTVPQWIFDTILEARKVWGISPSWKFFVKMTHKPLGNRDFWAGVRFNSTYMDATIEVDPHLSQDEYGRSALYHEVLHVAMAELIDLIDDQILPDLPPAHFELLRFAWRAELERLTVNLTRSVLRASDIGNKPEDI